MAQRVRDIIENAVRGYDRLKNGPDDGLDGWAIAACNTFNDVFDYRHVALMESVVEAVDNARDDEHFEATIIAAMHNLLAYRREHGLV